jgi:hypothetical protein
MSVSSMTHHPGGGVGKHDDSFPGGDVGKHYDSSPWWWCR